MRPRCARSRDFNPRSPHGERPSPQAGQAAKKKYFNPRSPHGERLDALALRIKRKIISIHAPLTGSDLRRSRPPPCRARISIHAPLTGSDHVVIATLSMSQISIHAPLTGSDVRQRHPGHVCNNFNPRSPHGERLATFVAPQKANVFQSTLPSRGATWPSSLLSRYSTISIHAPLTGSDPSVPRRSKTPADFNPRSPHGERLLPGRFLSGIVYFNPRSPHGERLRKVD